MLQTFLLIVCAFSQVALAAEYNSTKLTVRNNFTSFIILFSLYWGLIASIRFKPSILGLIGSILEDITLALAFVLLRIKKVLSGATRRYRFLLKVIGFKGKDHHNEALAPIWLLFAHATQPLVHGFVLFVDSLFGVQDHDRSLYYFENHFVRDVTLVSIKFLNFIIAVLVILLLPTLSLTLDVVSFISSMSVLILGILLTFRPAGVFFAYIIGSLPIDYVELSKGLYEADKLKRGRYRRMVVNVRGRPVIIASPDDLDDGPVADAYLKSKFVPTWSVIIRSIFTILFWGGLYLSSALILSLFGVGVAAIGKALRTLQRIFLAGLVVWLLPDWFYESQPLWIRRTGEAIPVITKFFRDLSAMAMLASVEAESLPHRSRKKLFRGSKRKFIRVFRMSTLKVVRYLDTWRLPEGIRASYTAPTISTIQEGFQMMADAGWPVDKDFKLTDQPTPIALSDKLWASFAFARTNFIVPIRPMAAAIATEMGKFGFEDIPGYIHTATYNNPALEISSLSRYFAEDPDREIPETLLDDLWDVVKSQYGYSVLTQPSVIIKNWVKKYNLGIGYWKEGRKGKRQMKRRDAIKLVGGLENFTALWERTLEFAATIVPLIPVFAKFETLKPKAVMKVRTILGSALPHHIYTTIFNYFPNHNYKIWEVPMKVGMPITGKAFGELWKSLSRRKYVFAGDMSAFDSSLPPQIVKLCGEIRKKGYEWHPDYIKISALIDVAYDALITSPLALRSTGDVFQKTRGFTTGHSSTSADNSLALVACYLYAWRKATGLPSSDFMIHNSLINFGDDHLLAYDDFPGWSPQIAMKHMAELGVTMRDEHPEANTRGVLGKSFLAKFPLISKRETARLIAAGVEDPPEFLTYHDRNRLIGKIRGQTLVKDKYQRYNRLVSYLYLTAHNEDIYHAVIRAANELKTKSATRWAKAGMRIQTFPSYDDVLYKWYTSNKDIVGVDERDEGVEFKGDEVRFYVGASFIDQMNAALSMVPEVLSPKYANASWIRHLHSQFRFAFGWPIDLIKRRNPAGSSLYGLDRILSRTPYEFLTPEVLDGVHTPLSDFELLVRHWIYLFIKVAWFGKYRPPSLLDMIEQLDKLSAEALFAYDGTVLSTAVTLNFHLFENFIIFILYFIPRIPFSIDIPKLDFSGFGTYFSVLVQNAWESIQPAGRVNFEPIRFAVQRHRQGVLSITAPTGVGKSTRLVEMIHRWTGKVVVVVEPRHVLVTSLTEYCSEAFAPTVYGSSTTGGFVPKGANIIYGTVQSLIQKSSYLGPEHIWVVDEAHIHEPHYDVLKRWLTKHGQYSIWLTATPDPEWATTTTTIEMEALNNWNVSTINHSVPDQKAYEAYIIDRSHLYRHGEKWLIFLPQVAAAERLQNLLPGKSSLLNSKEQDLDPDAAFILTTKVADAGLTIPDVDVVISMDIDVAVTTTSLGSSWKIKKEAVLYRLSQATMRQRAGRTGRTRHGTFFHVEVKGDYGPEPQTDYDELIAFGDLIDGKGDFLECMSPEAQKRLKKLKSKIPMDLLGIPISKGLQNPDRTKQENLVRQGDDTFDHFMRYSENFELNFATDSSMPILQFFKQ